MMVSLAKTRDKFGQQRQGRTDGAIRSTADRRPMGEDPSLASETAPTPAWRQTTRQRSQGARRDSVDSAQRRSLAGFARGIPSPATCWRRLRDWEEQGVWLTIWRAFLAELNQREQLDWSELFLDGSFAPAKKGARKSEKPSGARARSGWWWSTARVFLWESSFHLPCPMMPGFRKRRSRRST